MTAASTLQSYVTFEDYLAAEAETETKHEWLDGVVYAMGGGSIEHGRLSVRMSAALSAALAGRCTVLNSDVMVYIRATNLATYPDVSVTCGAIERVKVDLSGKPLGEALTNPGVIVEVLSPSTETYDRTEKFSHYMRLPSLKEYVLMSSDERRIEVHRRPEGRGHWTCEVGGAGGTVTICGAAFAVDDLYAA